MYFMHLMNGGELYLLYKVEPDPDLCKLCRTASSTGVSFGGDVSIVPRYIRSIDYNYDSYQSFPRLQKLHVEYDLIAHLHRVALLSSLSFDLLLPLLTP